MGQTPGAARPRRGHSALIELLRAAASDRMDLRLASFSSHEVDWAVQNGLGALLCRATKEDPNRESSTCWQQVLSADLTARVLVGEQIDAMTEILDHCADMTPITLLKGISLCRQVYPEAHLRPMRDIDFLVPKDKVSIVESALGDLGYIRRQPTHAPVPPDHHHGIPFWHPKTENWVEVHWGLVSPRRSFTSECAFRTETLELETRPLDLYGNRAGRLSDELQVVYLASHWAHEIPVPGGIVALVDMALLLNLGNKIDWGRTLELAGPFTSLQLQLVLSYLRSRSLAPIQDEVIAKLSGREHSLNGTELALLRRLIERHIVAGRPFRWPTTEPTFKTIWAELLQPRRSRLKVLRLGRYAIPKRLRQSIT